MSIKNLIRFIYVLLIIYCLCPPSLAQDAKTIQLSDLVQQVKGGQIDWGNRMIYGIGDGIIPDESKQPNRARAKLMAKDYAKMVAIANLLMVIEGAPASFEGESKDLMDKDPSLRRTIEGYVKNVEILKSETLTIGDNKIVRVTVGTKIYGEATPGTALLSKLAETEKPKQPPLIQIPMERSYPRPSTPTLKAETEYLRLLNSWQGPAASKPVDIESLPVTFKQEGPFTSLIIDARGFSVPQAISPKVRTHKGDQIYGSALDKSDPALRDGLVAYARTPEKARESERCGKKPLLVPAIGRGGGRSMCDLIISDEIAKQIKTEIAKSDFLTKHNVIFVVDPPGSGVTSALK